MNIKKQVLEKYKKALEAGQMASAVHLSDEEKELTRDIQLLTTKPFMYVANDKFDLTTKQYHPPLTPRGTPNLLEANLGNPRPPIKGGESTIVPSPRGGGLGWGENEIVIIDAQLESELAELSDEEKEEYLKELGLEESGLDKIIKTAYQTLNLITFFTAEPKETKAWTCAVGTKAPEAAGKIHTDFEKGFVKAEVVQYEKFLEAKGFHQAREKGWLKVEGKDYLMQDGDVVHFRFSL
jgi:hypothetical protein